MSPEARRRLATDTAAALRRGADGLLLLDAEIRAEALAAGVDPREASSAFGWDQAARKARAAAADLDEVVAMADRGAAA